MPKPTKLKKPTPEDIKSNRERVVKLMTEEFNKRYSKTPFVVPEIIRVPS